MDESNDNKPPPLQVLESKPTDSSPEDHSSSRTRRTEIQYEQFHHGPLPPASEFKKYDEVTPGAGDRIIGMAERQAKHRQTLEKIDMENQTLMLTAERQMGKDYLDLESRNTLMGIISAFVLSMTTILGSIYLVLKGHPWPGSIFGIGGLSSVVGIFIYGSKLNLRRQNRQEQAHDNEE